MESDKLTGKLARWALLLHEYEFEVVHKARVKNLDADGLSRNPSPLQEDLTRARWHGTLDQEAVPGWHASAYLAWMEGGSRQTIGNTRDGDAEDALELTQAQGTLDVWKDQGVLHQMQHGDFPLGSIPKEQDRIVHCMARSIGRTDWSFESGLMELGKWFLGQTNVLS